MISALLSRTPHIFQRLMADLENTSLPIMMDSRMARTPHGGRQELGDQAAWGVGSNGCHLQLLTKGDNCLLRGAMDKYGC